MKHIGLATLGRDAEIRHLPSGGAVMNLSLAVPFYDKNADKNRGTQWVDAALFGDRAESLAEFMVKGSTHCFTLSDMHIEFFERTDGSGGAKLVARVDSVELGPRREGGGDASSGARTNVRPPAAAPRPAGGQAAAPAAGKAPSGFDDMDDDIPF